MAKLREVKAVLLQMSQLNLMIVAFHLHELGAKEGTELLIQLGINPATARSRIKREATDVLINKAIIENFYKDEGEPVDFLSTVATVEQSLGYQLKVEDLSCKRWIYIIKSLKQKKD